MDPKYRTLFDAGRERSATDSVKWDVKPGELPMWVADMDFDTAPCVLDAIKGRLERGAFGYSDITSEWKNAYRSWWERRYQTEIPEEWLVYSAGVIPTISAAVRKFTTPGEKIIILTPVYNIFYNSILNNGRVVLECPLLEIEGTSYIDWDALEKAAADPQASAMIFCNPHNPTGRIWTREELIRVAEIAERNHVFIVSDEVHCDLTAPGLSYVSFCSLDPDKTSHVISCIAPTKAFNIAGIQTSAVVASDPAVRHKIWREINTDEVGEPNTFAVPCTVAAFSPAGEEWLEALREYLAENRRMASEFIEGHLPKLRVVGGDATYLLWIDCSYYCELYHCDSESLAKRIREKSGLILSVGVIFGPGGEHSLRMNLACPQKLLTEGLHRLYFGLQPEDQI